MPIAQRANHATRRRFYNAVPPFHAPMSKKSLKTIKQPDQFPVENISPRARRD
jgi:hypothetical protein